MSRARVIVGLVLLGVAAFAVTAYARQVPAGQGDEPAEPVDVSSGVQWPDWADLAQPVDDFAQEIWNLSNEVDNMNSNNQQPTVSIDANVRAFLATIRACEGTEGQPDPYRVCFAYKHVVQNLADHPAVTGEWRGEPLSVLQCAGAGLGPGCVSTAAGAYQFIKPTWVKLRNRLGLTDFGPVSQDLAAVQLLRECGAFDRLAVGDLAGAVTRARKTWASLPGANFAGQGMRSMSNVQAWFQQAGGSVA